MSDILETAPAQGVGINPRCGMPDRPEAGRVKRGEKTMQEPTDALAEACQVAGVVAGEEQEIKDTEKEIADRFRAICKTIFAESEYRMPTSYVGYGYLDPEGIEVWNEIGSVLVDRIKWDGDFYGRAQTLRVTRGGRIISVWQVVIRTNSYRLLAEDMPLPDEGDYNQELRDATDHEIAANAVELANDLLKALRKRIDAAKDEKTELKRIAGLGE